jgi:hypothetical protein
MSSRFVIALRPRMAEHANTSSLLYYAPIEENQSFDHTLPSSSGKLHDIELLDSAVGMAGGFRRSRGRKESHSASADLETWHPPNSGP